MKFTKLVAILAITALAAQANAYGDGTLRRSTVVAQADRFEGDKAVNININNTPQTVTQPVTVVEANPAMESKAEGLRKARVDAEVQTEQKIVEKLEDSRLREERERADRLFGNKFDAPPTATPPPAAQQAAPVVVAPVVIPDKKEQQQPMQQPTQVTNIEIVQPMMKEEKKEEPKLEKTEVIKEEKIIEEKAEVPVESNKMAAPVVEAPSDAKPRFYVSGLLGNLNYNASNVKSNYGLGVAVGTILQEHWGVELSYFYSNHTVDTFWQQPLYRTLDQNDIAIGTKYYFLTGRIKPFVGANLTYINRKYNDRIQQGNYWNANTFTTSENTQAVDMGALIGVDFSVSENFLLGIGYDYNFNVMNNNPINDNNYGLPSNTQALETINYSAIKVSAKYLF